MYDIEIKYKTGNSFSSHEETTRLEGDWKSLEIAKENLQRIKQHYEWSKGKHEHWHDEKPKKPLFMKELTSEAKKYEETTIPLKLDDGSTWQMSTFWIGYFEHLISIDIVIRSYKIEF